MGNACDICEQQTGDAGFTPYSQRTYTEVQKDPPLKPTSEKVSEIGLGDAPNPNNATPTTIPALNPMVR